MAAAAFAFAFVPQARAVDGCKVLLCLAGNWKNISQCRPEVEQAMHDVARGKGWPECDSGGNSSTANTFLAPELCPRQYRIQFEMESGVAYQCSYSGVVNAVVDGQPWSRTYWSPSGDSVTEWLPAAKAAFASDPTAIDNKFERDFAEWLAAQPPAPTPTAEPTGGA
jgi:hypothetical protein